MRILVAVLAMLIATAGRADDMAREIVDQARAVLARPQDHADPQIGADAAEILLHPPQADALNDIIEKSNAGPHERTPAPMGTIYRLFVSQSMPASELRDAMALTRSRNDMMLVFRGLKPGQTLGQLQKAMLSLMTREDLDRAGIPLLQLDPPHFQSGGIKVVPTLVRYVDDKEVARVTGLINPVWLEREVAGGRHGDLGQQGEVLPLIESDLMADMQQKAQAWDWPAMAKVARDRFWSRQSYVSLPAAEQSRVRRIDPSIRVTQDIVAPDGTLIAKAGAVVNPLEGARFTQRLVIFDATDERQCAVAARLTREAGMRRVTLMTTRWTEDRGFDGLAKLTNELGRPLTLLTPEIKERFGLERVPSSVEADGLVFVVAEYVPEKGS